jgi:hypothetical protein
MVKECIQLINTTRNPKQNKGLPLAFGAQLDGFFSKLLQLPRGVTRSRAAARRPPLGEASHNVRRNGIDRLK